MIRLPRRKETVFFPCPVSKENNDCTVVVFLTGITAVGDDTIIYVSPGETLEIACWSSFSCVSCEKG